MNFMLLVPDASVPAVEICSDTSAAGIGLFRIADVVVLDKHHLHQAVHVRIAVHQFRASSLIYLMMPLARHIARRGFCSEQVDGGREIRAGDAPLLQAVV